MRRQNFARQSECAPRENKPRVAVDTYVAKRVQVRAFESLSRHDRLTTNLYLNPYVLEKGEILGPGFRKVIVDRPSVLCFADDNPRASFAHACRYLIYDAKTGKPLRRVLTQYPPYPLRGLGMMRLFYQAVKPEPDADGGDGPIEIPCPVPLAKHGRYAILFAGAADQNHLNDLELSYRMLVGRYGFSTEDVFVLFHDGTRGADGGPFIDNTTGLLRKWPGDGSDFQIVPTDMGSKAAFRNVLVRLSTRLQPDDLLFIHTEGHGGNDWTPPADGVFLFAYPDETPGSDRYFASELHDDLATLAPCGALLVLMNQCYAGGFSAPVVAGSKALATSIACAARSDTLAYATPDMLWNDFALDWMEAQLRQHVDRTKLASSPDTNGDGAIEAREAFDYARDHSEGLDTPNYACDPKQQGDTITLGES